VKFINASPQRREKFRHIQEIHGGAGTALLLLLDCKTRWNSTYLMLRRALKLRGALQSFITTWEDKDISSLQLGPDEWKHVEYILELLYDFWLYTTLLSEHCGPTIHQVYDVYNSLFNHIEDAISLLKNKTRYWKRKLYYGLLAAKKKLQVYYNRTYGTEGLLYACATILNPCYKMKAFEGSSWLDDNGINWHQHYYRKFKKIFKYYCKKFPDIEVQPTTSSQLSGLSQALLRSKRRRLSPLEDAGNQQSSSLTTLSYTELEKYLQERK
jgi:hypothetical protein